MRAIGVTQFGGPDALHLVDVPAEPLGPGQVRLRVTAATVNPTDTYARNGTYAGRDPVKEFPYVPGMDVAGELVEIGGGVDLDIAVGERVMGIVVPSGAHGGDPEELVLPPPPTAPGPARARRRGPPPPPLERRAARPGARQKALRPGPGAA